MKYFYTKLHPPRPDFPQTITPAEMALMREHSAYLREFAAKRWVVAFGPVADPAGAFGVGLWEVPDDVDVEAIGAADPVIRAGLGFRYELHRMPSLVTRA
jgi:uncharacterized protein YciI